MPPNIKHLLKHVNSFDIHLSQIKINLSKFNKNILTKQNYGSILRMKTVIRPFKKTV